MTVSKALVSLADVKTLLPIRSGNYDFDARLKSLIRTATSQIERALSRRLTRQRHTQYFRTVENRSARLNFAGSDESGVLITARGMRYVLAGLPVVIDEANPFDISYFDEPLPDSSYVIDTEKGVLRVSYGCSDTVNGLKVSYTAGFPVITAGEEEYLDLSEAEDLRQACITQTVALFKRNTAENAGTDGEKGKGSSPGGQFTGNGGLIPDVAAMLQPYKVQLLGLS